MADIQAANDHFNDLAGALLVEKELSVAVAESVTAGALQNAFALAENATMFFQGGITVYNLGQKCRHLNVDPIHALSCNCVSQRVANELALNVCTMFNADFGISVTGYAASVPEKHIAHLFAYMSIVRNDQVLLEKKLTAEEGEPAEVQQQYASDIIRAFHTLLKNL